jgi:hypothetical protein
MVEVPFAARLEVYPTRAGPLGTENRDRFSKMDSAIEALVPIKEWPTTGGAYFVRARDCVKIGQAENVKARLRGLQTANPDHLELLHIEPAAQGKRLIDIEDNLQRRFNKLWVRGEWYALKDELLDFLLKKQATRLNGAKGSAPACKHYWRYIDRTPTNPIRIKTHLYCERCGALEETEEGLWDRLSDYANEQEAARLDWEQMTFLDRAKSIIQSLKRGHSETLSAMLLSNLQELGRWYSRRHSSCNDEGWDETLGYAQKIVMRDGDLWEADAERILNITPSCCLETDDSGGSWIDWSDVVSIVLDETK